MIFTGTFYLAFNISETKQKRFFNIERISFISSKGNKDHIKKEGAEENEKEYICCNDLRNNRRYIICTWHVHGTDPGVERISAGSCHGCDRRSCASEHGICLTMVWSNMILGIVIGIVGIVVLLSLIPLTKGLK